MQEQIKELESLVQQGDLQEFNQLTLEEVKVSYDSLINVASSFFHNEEFRQLEMRKKKSFNSYRKTRDQIVYLNLRSKRLAGQLVEISIANNHLTNFPYHQLNSFACQELNLFYNKLENSLAVFGKLVNLKILSIKGNNFTPDFQYLPLSLQ